MGLGDTAVLPVQVMKTCGEGVRPRSSGAKRRDAPKTRKQFSGCGFPSVAVVSQRGLCVWQPHTPREDAGRAMGGSQLGPAQRG
jgi:hypothetical protein